MKMKYKFSIIGLLAIFMTESCKPKIDNNSILRKYEISEFQYLIDFVGSNNHNNTVYIDSFNILFEPLKVYNINDTNIVFACFFNNRFLLNIHKDSIDIYSSLLYGQVSIPKVNSLLELKNLDTALQVIEQKSIILYKYRLGNIFLKLISVNRNCKEFYFLEYHQKNWVNWSFIYYTTIKNDFLKLGKTRYLNTWPYNIDSLKYYNSQVSAKLNLSN